MRTIEEYLQAAEEFERLQNGATPGPWERFNYIGQAGGLRLVRTALGVDVPLECKEPLKQIVSTCERADDAAFITAARSTPLAGMVKELVAEVERLRAGSVAATASDLIADSIALGGTVEDRISHSMGELTPPWTPRAAARKWCAAPGSHGDEATKG